MLKLNSFNNLTKTENKYSRRGFLKAVGAGLLSTTLVSSLTLGGYSKGKIKIQIMRPGTPSKVRKWLEPAIEEFEKENPGITVEPIYQGWTGWQTKITTLLQAGDQPHVQLWPDFWQMKPLIRDKLVPLEGLVDPDIIEKNPLSDKVKLDDTQYLLPSSTGVFVIMYRKDVFDEAGLDPDSFPADWEELIGTVKAIKNTTDVPPLAIPVSKFVSTHDYVSVFYFSATGHTWLEGGKPIFNTDLGIKALEFWKGLKPYAQPNALNYGRGDLRPPFRDKKVAIHLDGPWILPLLEEKFGDLDKSPIGFAFVPKGPSVRGSEAGFDGWVISREERAEASGKLISFLSSPEQQYRHDWIYGQNPIYPSELERPKFQADYWKVFLKTMSDYAFHRYYHPQPGQVWQIFVENEQSVWVGKKTPEQAWTDAEQEITKL